MDYYWICFATPPIQFTPKKVKGYCAITTFTGMEISPVTICVFLVFFSPKTKQDEAPQVVSMRKFGPTAPDFVPKLC